MKCSVVIPTLGRDSLFHVLRALERQLVPPLEVIVANDGEHASLPSTVTSDRLRMRTVRTGPRLGAAAARNAALRECRGDVVLFLDDDVVGDPNLIAAHLDVHRANPAVVAIGFRRRVPYAVWNTTPSSDWPERSGNDPRLCAVGGPDWMTRWWIFFQTCNASVSNAAIHDVGGFDDAFRGWGFEDTDLGYRLYSAGMSVHAVDSSIPLHLDSEPSILDRTERSRAYLRNAMRFLRKWNEDPTVRLLVRCDVWRCLIETEDDPHAA